MWLLKKRWEKKISQVPKGNNENCFIYSALFYPPHAQCPEAAILYHFLLLDTCLLCTFLYPKKGFI